MSLDNEMDQMVRGNEKATLRAEIARLTGELAEARTEHIGGEAALAAVRQGVKLAEENKRLRKLCGEACRKLKELADCGCSDYGIHLCNLLYELEFAEKGGGE